MSRNQQRHDSNEVRYAPPVKRDPEAQKLRNLTRERLQAHYEHRLAAVALMPEAKRPEELKGLDPVAKAAASVLDADDPKLVSIRQVSEARRQRRLDIEQQARSA